MQEIFRPVQGGVIEFGTVSPKSAAFLTVVLLVVGLPAQSKPAPAPASRHYFNANYNFCVDYPANWQTSEPFDRNAVALIPPGVQGDPGTEITVGGRVDQPSQHDEARPETLDEIWASGVKALTEYGKATAVSVIEQKRLSLAGYPALATRYEYMKNGQRWNGQQFLLLTRSRAVFELTLSCHPDELSQLMPVFDAVVRSFKIQCDPKLPERP